MQAMHQALEQEYNASQMAAMRSGLSGDAVVLIQVQMLMIAICHCLMPMLRQQILDCDSNMLF